MVLAPLRQDIDAAIQVGRVSFAMLSFVAAVTILSFAIMCSLHCCIMTPLVHSIPKWCLRSVKLEPTTAGGCNAQARAERDRGS